MCTGLFVGNKIPVVVAIAGAIYFDFDAVQDSHFIFRFLIGFDIHSAVDLLLLKLLFFKFPLLVFKL